jgi:hypothetical protein
MKRYLVATATAACVTFVLAGTAAAAVTFSPSSLSGFIGRGDVITGGGMKALVANPLVSYTNETQTQLTCTWPDGTTRSLTITIEFFVLFQAEARYAPRNDTITGYTFSRQDIVDAELSPPVDPSGACMSLSGIPAGTPTVSSTVVSMASVLTYFMPGGSFSLSF